VDRADKKWRCNIDQLTRSVFQELSASNRAFIRFLGVRAGDSKDPDPELRAEQRADTLQRAVIQWLGPGKYPPERFDVAYASGSEADPQVQVWVSYRPQVISNPQTPLPPTSATPAAPAASPSATLPNLGLKSVTNHTIKIGIGTVEVVVPKRAEMKFSKIQLRQALSIQISIKGEVGKLIDLFKAPEISTDPNVPSKLGPPLRVSLSVALNGVPHLAIDATAKADFSNQTITGSLGFTLVGGDCQFKVPAGAIAKIAEAEKALRKFSPQPDLPPTPEESRAKAAEAEKTVTPPPAPTTSNPNLPGGTSPGVEPPAAGSANALDQLPDIAEVANTLYEALEEMDKAKAQCQKGPTIKVGPFITVPFGQDQPGTVADPSRRTNAGVGVTGEF
jgi:hypothetical protein